MAFGDSTAEFAGGVADRAPIRQLERKVSPRDRVVDALQRMAGVACVAEGVLLRVHAVPARVHGGDNREAGNGRQVVARQVDGVARKEDGITGLQRKGFRSVSLVEQRSPGLARHPRVGNGLAPLHALVRAQQVRAAHDVQGAVCLRRWVDRNVNCARLWKAGARPHPVALILVWPEARIPGVLQDDLVVEPVDLVVVEAREPV
mmetsp:Transcript_17303/g.37393  ORF Transcript_17303/g.37393 Transcript_17303/m.37393 type:complete len:204 (+) Transcript_17303:247-858(+)